jgi:hypothetical protein
MDNCTYDPQDDDYEPAHQERLPLGSGSGAALILQTWPDGYAVAYWEIRRPDGGCTVHL